MKIVKYLFYVVVVLIASAGVAVSCYANGDNDRQAPEIFLIVTDNSKEVYGTQLKNEVFLQLRSQLNSSVNKESEIRSQNTNPA